jgi:4-diphosphocytidyl-2-C-methyl-D-erythritol kinase
LEVLDKRSDGYHEINTVFALISLADNITITRSEKLSVATSLPLGIGERDNIAFKAALALMDQKRSTGYGADIFIRKNIPSGAGLGGGSTDAASVLTALNTFWKLGFDPETISEIAAKLGADVPFFLLNGTAAGSGKGENLQLIEYKPEYHLLVVFPDININTRWAYTELDRNLTKREPTDISGLLLKSLSEPTILKKHLINDFEKPIFERYPAIGRIKKVLYDNDAIYASMSGSGSAVFGMFKDKKQAEKAVLTFPDYKTFHCKII